MARVPALLALCGNQFPTLGSTGESSALFTNISINVYIQIQNKYRLNGWSNSVTCFPVGRAPGWAEENHARTSWILVFSSHLTFQLNFYARGGLPKRAMLQHVKLSQTLTFNLVVDIFTSWITHLWSSQKIMLYFTVLKSVQTFVLHVGSTALDKRKFKSIFSSQQLLLLTSKQALPAFSDLMQLILKQKAVRAPHFGRAIAWNCPLSPPRPSSIWASFEQLAHPPHLSHPSPSLCLTFHSCTACSCSTFVQLQRPLGIMPAHKDLSFHCHNCICTFRTGNYVHCTHTLDLKWGSCWAVEALPSLLFLLACTWFTALHILRSSSVHCARHSSLLSSS